MPKHITPLQAALSYAEYHWSVIPMRTREKRPMIKWQEYQSHCATQEEINHWFQRWPEANVGIVTGSVSGIIVIDIDIKHGGDDSLAIWEKEHGPLPRTMEVITGGGGRHLYFKHHGGVVHNRVGIVPGIDLRGDGGCAVAPPSIHPSGKPYTWRAGHEPDKIAIAELPTWLSDLLRYDAQRTGHSIKYWRQLVQKDISEGERNNTIASLAGHLLWHGVDPDVVMELLLCWNRARCSPPLNDEEVICTVLSISRLHEAGE